MKKTFILLLFLISLTSFAQQKENITIEWIDNSSINSEQIKIKVPVFNNSSFNYNYENRTITYVKKVAVNGFADESSLQIADVVYETVTKEQLGELNIAKIPSSINAKITNMNNPASQKAVIEFSPIIKSGLGFQRVKSLSYTFSNTQNRSNQFTANSIAAVSNSVLSSGEWYRFYVEKSGVYKISKNFLQSLGMNLNGVDARNIKIYGNGGRMLPLLNSTYYPEDLTENAIQIIGEADGSFDNSDYILFYAEGLDNWNQESLTHLNLFSDKSYYYITAQGSQGKRITNIAPISATATLTTTVFDDYQFHEIDKFNIARLGRRWFGEQFSSQNEQSFKFEFYKTNLHLKQ